MKPAILAFTRYYLPGYRAGGPIRSVANMVERLSSDFDFRIVAMDRDMSDSEPYENVEIDEWNTIGRATVFYASRGALSFRRIRRLMSDTAHDLVYVNSLFDPVFTLRPLLARRLGLVALKPLIIAPRGEFSANALKLKNWKKIPYLALAKKLGLYRGVTWQASTDLEALAIVRTMGRRASNGMSGRIVIASNLAASPADEVGRHVRLARSQKEPLRICFLSRISPMKNLDYALRVLAKVRTPVRFSIYGPLEAESYWAVCQRLIATLPPNVSADYCGVVEHVSVVQTLAQHDLFFLPTRGENFGHVIQEALRAGVPVLVSDQTPWRALEKRGVGWGLPLEDPSEFVRVVEQVASWSADTAFDVSKRAKHVAMQVGTDSDALEANLRLFRSALGR